MAVDYDCVRFLVENLPMNGSAQLTELRQATSHKQRSSGVISHIGSLLNTMGHSG